MTPLRRLLLSVLGAAASLASLTAADFTPGNLVLLRVGSGTGSLANTGNPVFLDEFTPTGSKVQSIALPTAANGAHHPFYLSGTATSEGFLSRSNDGRYLILTGYGGSGVNLPSSTGSTIPRVVARVDGSGNVDTTTALTDFVSGGNPRSAASQDGSAFWLAGSAGGVRHAALGATTSSSIATTFTNLRVAQIFNGQLYVSSASSTLRLGTVGAGLPTTGGQTITQLPGFPTTNSPYGYFFADLDGGVIGVDTVYVADDSANNIQKYSLVGGTWTASGTISAGFSGIRGLTGVVSGTTVTLYGVAATSGGANTSRFLTFADTTGHNVPVAGTMNLLFTDIANTAFRGIALAPVGGSGPVAVAPSVTGITPAAGALSVPPGTTISVGFNAPIIGEDGWFTITGSATGTRTATVSVNGSTYILKPTTRFAEGETVTVSLDGNKISDAATGTLTMAASPSINFTIATYVPMAIHTVQGTGSTSAYVGQTVSLTGVVTSLYPSPESGANFGGFYIQLPDGEADSNLETSEGIFVNTLDYTPAIGDSVKVAGLVQEQSSSGVTSTRLTAVGYVDILNSGGALPAPQPISLPFESLATYEKFEGMRVKLEQTLVVTANHLLGQYGEVTLATEKLHNPTNVVAPGSAAVAFAAENALKQIILDDSSNYQYPSPTPFLPAGTPETRTLRTGSTTSHVVGVLDHRFGGYTIEATEPVTFVPSPRPPVPAVAGTLKVVIGNVLNYFNGNGLGGGFPTSRGADFPEEFDRQHAKIVAGIAAMAPDIMGLTEIERDGFDPNSSLAQLVAGINQALGTTAYEYVTVAGDTKTDAIRCAFIYNSDTVETVGAAKAHSIAVFERAPLAQTFRQISNGEKFTVTVNHFKSKGGSASGADVDQGDGQGAHNASRTEQAQALVAWLATDPTESGDPDFLIIGDLNAYAKEDPIVALETAGYVNLTEAAEGEGGYSYQFDGTFGHLDHALASGSLAAQVVDTATWHVNSDEPAYLDYNTHNGSNPVTNLIKSPEQAAINVGTPYRYSDHDPVVVGLNLGPPPATDITASLQITRGGLVLNRKTGRFGQTITIKNISAQAFTGPVSFVFGNLSANATLFSPAGFTSVAAPLNSPYLTVNVGADSALGIGETVTVAAEFTNGTTQTISYNPTVLAGPGAR